MLHFYFQEVDIAIGAVTITGPRETAVDFSIPYYETGCGFIANVPRELSKWAALLRPYKLTVWLPLMIAIFLSGPVFWILSKLDPKKDAIPISLSKSYDTSYKIIVYQGKIFLFIQTP